MNNSTDDIFGDDLNETRLNSDNENETDDNTYSESSCSGNLLVPCAASSPISMEATVAFEHLLHLTSILFYCYTFLRFIYYLVFSSF